MSEQPLPPLSSTARAVLTEFADSFPASAHYRGGRRLRKGDWERVFPDTAHDVEAKEAFLAAVDELVALGVVSVKWTRFRDGSEVDALYLEDPKRLFELVGRPSPDAVRDSMLEVLCSQAWTDTDGLSRAVGERVAAVREWLQATLEARHPAPVADARELADLAALLRIEPETARRFPIRALSVRLYNDSKRLERLLPLADRVTRSVLGVAHSEQVGLARSYPDVSLALRGTLVLSGPREWTCRGEVVTLPAATVDAVAAVRVESSPVGEPGVLSVENKETFYVLSSLLREANRLESIAALTYCGGHPHASYLALLKRFCAAGITLYHFGDLDPDGILIFAELQSGLGCDLHTYLMDVATLRSHLSFGFEPPESRLALLRSSLAALPPRISALAAEVLAHRRGVEQEVIDVTRSPGV